MSFLLDELHGRIELPSTVALDRAEDVTCHALRVDTHRARPVGTQFAFDKDDELFRGNKRSEADDAKLAGFCRKARFSHLVDCFRSDLPPGFVIEVN
jgi:hypothetical protein